MIGSDLYGVIIDFQGLHTFIDEGPISKFLEEQKSIDNCVDGWTFTGPPLKYVLHKLKPEEKEETFFADITGYK